jgi:hypothetical protein
VKIDNFFAELKRRNVALLPVEKDSIKGLKMIRYLAMIAASVGDKDLACAVATSPCRHADSGNVQIRRF